MSVEEDGIKEKLGGYVAREAPGVIKKLIIATVEVAKWVVGVIREMIGQAMGK